ncbi:hypothetical protein P261_00737 [Lachnospiraceae bacterium TWA4]|nr:hypothetical protein P261_00737 [Lachnospiraceae bacterium TWA4]
MTDTEFRRLGRKELIEIIYELKKNEENLTSELEAKKEELQAKEEELSEKEENLKKNFLKKK